MSGSPRAAVPRAIAMVVRALPCAAWLAPRPRRALAALAFAGAVLAVVALTLAAAAPRPAACWWPTQLVAIAVAGASAALCAARALLIARERTAWLVAAGTMVVALARGGVWIGRVDGRPEHLPPVPYVVLGVLVLAGAAVFLVLLMRARFTTARGHLLEAIAGALVLPALLMALAIAGVLPSGGETASEHAMWAIDPVVGTGVACIALAALSASGWRPGRTWGLLLAGALAGLLLALLVSRDSRGLADAFLPLFLLVTLAPALAAWQLPPARPIRPLADGRSLTVPLGVATMALVFLMADRPVHRPLVVTGLAGAGLTLAAVRAARLYASARSDRSARAPRHATAPAAAPSPDLSALTGRQLEVVTLLADGRMHKQVAHDLGVSPRTVEKHVAGARRKLGVRTNNELIVLLNGPAPAAVDPA